MRQIFLKTGFVRLGAAWWALTVLLFAPAFGQGLDLSNMDPSEPWNITADKLQYDNMTNTYRGSGNVLIWRSGYRMEADEAGFDRNNNSLWAVGNVTVKGGGDVVTGDRVYMDLATETGLVENGTLFIQATHFFIRGGRIEKLGAQSYRVDDASLTTCDPDDPDWVIKAANVKVTVGGYGTARNIVVKARKAPVFYSPYLVFPAKTERQTGLLPPQVSQSSRQGWGINQPFYKVMGESADMTLYAHPMEKRGVQAAAEMRYVLNPKSKGYIFGSYLQDRTRDDGVGNNSLDWGYENDLYLRPNQDRYWVAAKHDQQWKNGLKFRLDADFVSDQDYLRDFKDGYTGYSAVNREFAQEFGRDLDDYDETIRKNSLYLQKGWDSYSANAEAKWYDNVIARRFDEPDTTLQTLPFVGFSGTRQSLFGSFLAWEFDSGYSHFYREEGISGNRFDVNPRFVAPIDFGRYMSMETTVGLRETLYNVTTWDEEPSRDDRTFSREMYDLKTEFSSELVRVFNLRPGNGKIDKIRHAFTPSLSYNYRPDDDQEKYPLFDHVDRLEAKNHVTLALTNSLLGRSSVQRKENSIFPYEYKKLCWFEVSASYNINEANEEDASEWTEPHRRQPFSPVSARLELEPVQWLALESTTKWSPYSGNFVYNAHGVTLSGRGNELSAEYIKARESSETVLGKARFRLGESWSAYGGLERDLEAGERVRNYTGLIYEAACWAIDLGYSDEPGEQRYTLQFTLTGLGALGRSAAD
ncbi:LPS-assembly protein LptD [Desulfatibacillum aliphaticivorans]|uniref:LPS-assembly protein LptD n=1 Tax=Desulfatibacillum aliphaticivorans TaxID=218208 RepID=UPI0003FB5395|nr:LPS assembly protein LptD [Desulfatibacillum aliphaticivorans]